MNFESTREYLDGRKALGLERYGKTLAEAGLMKSTLWLMAAEELADFLAYAGEATRQDPMDVLAGADATIGYLWRAVWQNRQQQLEAEYWARRARMLMGDYHVS